MRMSVATFRLAWLVATISTALILCTSPGCGRDATVENDLSTPRSAATVFTRAVEAGDGTTAKTAAYGGGVELEWVEAMAQSTSGMKKLVAVTETRFGSEAQNLMVTKNALHMSKAVASAEVQFNGERATVVTAGEALKIPMKRVEGNWKIDVGALTRGEDLTQAVKQLRALGVVAPQLAKQVEAGKFTSVKDIQKALAQAVVETLFRPGAAPATVPATPATPPPTPATS